MPGRCTRRAFLLASVVAPFASTVFARDAGAAVSWCRRDPIVQIGNKVANIYLSSLEDIRQATTGPIQMIISVPTGVPTAVLAYDEGFGQGYQLSFVEDPGLPQPGETIRLNIDTFVPATGIYPVQVEFVPEGAPRPTKSRSSITNVWIPLRPTL